MVVTTKNKKIYCHRYLFVLVKTYIEIECNIYMILLFFCLICIPPNGIRIFKIAVRKLLYINNII